MNRRNAVHYDTGPLTTICPPVLINVAIYAIPIFGMICSSLL